jgi:signal transduction histidine kinase
MADQQIPPQPGVIERIINPLLRLIKAQMNVHGALILMRDPQTDMYLLVDSTDGVSSGVGSVVRPDEDMVSRVAQRLQPMIINDYPRWAGRKLDLKLDQIATDAYLCVPLLDGNRYLGGLVASSISSARPFSVDDIPTLKAYAPIIAAILAPHSPLDLRPELREQMRVEAENEIKELRQVRKQMARDADQLHAIFFDTVSIQEEERNRIAQDLHDGSNQLIVGAIYEIQAAQQRLLNAKVDQVDEALESAKKLLRKIETENRKIINDLRPPMLTNHGLVATFKWYLENLSQRADITYELACQGVPRRYPAEREITIFRILQEGLNNCVKHSQSSRVDLLLDFQPDFLMITLNDYGRGFTIERDQSMDQRNFGIIGMRERALSIGSQLEIHTSPGQGTCLTLHIPNFVDTDDPLGKLEQLHSFHVAYKLNGTVRKAKK